MQPSAVFDEINASIEDATSRRALRQQWRQDGWKAKMTRAEKVRGVLAGLLGYSAINHLAIFLINGGLLYHAGRNGSPLAGTIFADAMFGAIGSYFTCSYAERRAKIRAGKREDFERWGVASVSALQRAKRIALLEEAKSIDLTRLISEREQQELQAKLERERQEAERQRRHERERQEFARQTLAAIER